jgi:hypothetical protein
MFRLLVIVAVLSIPLVGCGSKSEDNAEAGDQKEKACAEPENPYAQGSGHYAGYEWAEEKGSGGCEGRSESFNEGCEEYETQEDEYQECEAAKGKK